MLDNYDSKVDAEEILAKVMVQTSRTSGLSIVYAELLSFDGCEMYVKPVEPYFDSLPAKASFADLMRLAQKRDEEACIGVKIGAFSNEPKKLRCQSYPTERHRV